MCNSETEEIRVDRARSWYCSADGCRNWRSWNSQISSSELQQFHRLREFGHGGLWEEAAALQLPFLLRVVEERQHGITGCLDHRHGARQLLAQHLGDLLPVSPHLIRGLDHEYGLHGSSHHVLAGYGHVAQQQESTREWASTRWIPICTSHRALAAGGETSPPATSEAISAPARIAAAAGRCVPIRSVGLLDRVCAAPRPPPAAAETPAPPSCRATPAVGRPAPDASGQCRRTYLERADSARFGVIGSCHLRPGPPATGAPTNQQASHPLNHRLGDP